MPGMSAPAKHVEESWQSAEFFANKVLMEHRGTPHAAWVHALKDAVMALRCVPGLRVCSTWKVVQCISGSSGSA